MVHESEKNYHTQQDLIQSDSYWLIVSCHFRNPATFLHAYTCLPLAYATRQASGAILQDVADSGVLFAILMCRHKVYFILFSYSCDHFIMLIIIFLISHDLKPYCRSLVLSVHRKHLFTLMICCCFQTLLCRLNHLGKSE